MSVRRSRNTIPRLRIRPDRDNPPSDLLNRRSLMRSLFVRAILPALILAACDTPTDSPLNELLVERAQWQAQGLTDYSYVWEQDGFFNRFAGQAIRLQIRGGVLQSAVFVATGDSVPGPLTWFPTIDQMFEQAIAAAHGQRSMPSSSIITTTTQSAWTSTGLRTPADRSWPRSSRRRSCRMLSGIHGPRPQGCSRAGNRDPAGTSAS